MKITNRGIIEEYNALIEKKRLAKEKLEKLNQVISDLHLLNIEHDVEIHAKSLEHLGQKHVALVLQYDAAKIEMELFLNREVTI